MTNTKLSLKAAKAALDSQNFVQAAAEARLVLEDDRENYFGNVFLGRALEKQDRLEEAISPYEAATRIKPSEELAWKGLCNVYESQGSRGVGRHTLAALKLAQIYANHDDAHQCHSIVDKIVDLAQEYGSRNEYKDALRILLPTSPIYSFLEGRIQKPSFTFIKLAEITESDEKDKINRIIGERRTRLGAKLDQVTVQVTREVLKVSVLEDLYQNVVDWTSDDAERRLYEEKLLQHAYHQLNVVTAEDKPAKREKVMRLAHGMVIIGHPYKLAWDLELEWQDFEDTTDLDRIVLSQYIQFFQHSGLSAILRGFFEIKLEPDEQEKDDTLAERNTVEGSSSLGAVDRLELITDGLVDAPKSALAHRLVAQYFLQVEDHESCVKASRKAISIFQSEKDKSGFSFQSNFDAINTNLATSLIYYQSPKHHPEAEKLFNDILTRKPDYTSALLGVGLVYEDQQDYQKASNFLDRALGRDPENVAVAAEAAWCKALIGDIEQGLQDLRKCLVKGGTSKSMRRELKSQVYYRIGKCLWDINTNWKSRKDRKGSYAEFITAIKMNPSFAPAYTSLGIYYQDYTKDKKRARQCFQKAFELSASEIVAAEYLAQAFADDGDWDIVEVVSERVIGSDLARPAPGSKRKAISWPFAAMAVVQINRQDFPRAVVSFQSALRISPDDHNSWIGLGESYLSSGRYNAASRTLEHAKQLLSNARDQSNPWFAFYMHANVHRELGEYDEAVAGYRRVLEDRAGEYGVAIALLQTYVESAWRSIEIGHFQAAAKTAREAILMAETMSSVHFETINFWKAVADSCSVFFRLPGLAGLFPVEKIQSLLSNTRRMPESQVLVDIDQITEECLMRKLCDEGNSHQQKTLKCACAAILASKREVQAAFSDPHAQSIAWYNLGWAEYRTKNLLGGVTSAENLLSSSKCSKAAVASFKKAIELEASNPDLWDALGVATTTANPKVAQHSFVRSLHINERNPRAWTNLGVLYMQQTDHELAHEAFCRAQAIDPDCVDAWVGEGLVALDFGDAKEALVHFTHAVEIADASDVGAKARFITAAFDDLLSPMKLHNPDLEAIATPLFTLRQMEVQVADNLAYRHIATLLLERTGDYGTAIIDLQKICDELESIYEQTEAPDVLGSFITVKSDLARNQLAAGDNISASENAETALDLSIESDTGALTQQERRKVRLSAHLTAGLARNFSEDPDTSVQMFRDALQESEGDAEVLCLLSKVLWAKSKRPERDVAKEQLMDYAQKGPSSTNVVILLGAIAILDGDEETKQAVSEDLQSLRTSEGITKANQDLIGSLLYISTSISGAEVRSVISERSEALESIMLSPPDPKGWSELAKVAKEPLISGMSLRNAEASVPPSGYLDAEQLAQYLAGYPSIRNAQRSIMMCPSVSSGWQALAEYLS